MEQTRVRICPYCMEETHVEANYCRGCGRILQNDRTCPYCREPVHKEATRCRFCHSDISESAVARMKKKAERPQKPVDAEIVSSSIGACIHLMSITAIIYPPELLVTNERISLKKRTLFGLRVHEQKISCRKVASVRFNKGIIWATITLETHGGAMADLTVPALDPDEAQKMVQTIEEVIQTHDGQSDGED